MITLTKQLSCDQYKWRNDPAIYKWTRQNGLISWYDQGDWLEKIKDDPTIQMFGILNPNNIFVGTCGLTSIDLIHGQAEFSLFIGPEFQKKGYGKQALIELLKYGFKHLRLHRIWGETFQKNPALKMFLQMGMRKEGYQLENYFKDGEFINSILVAILDSEARSQSWWN